MVQTLTGDKANDHQKPNGIQLTEHGNRVYIMSLWTCAKF
jgi:hypothetical protein